MTTLATLLGLLAPPAGAQAEHYLLDAGQMFTLFFIVLGPLKLLGSFLRDTHSLSVAELRALSLRATVIASISVIAGGYAGSTLLKKWEIDPQILLLSVGLIFFIVAFKLVMQQYESPHTQAPSSADAPPPHALKIVFPAIVPPYGIAVVIVLLALSDSSERILLIFGMVVAIMLLNLLAMLFVRSIMKGAGIALMQVLGAVLGVLQVALALRILLLSLQNLGVLTAAGR